MIRLFLIDGTALAYRSFFSFISNPLTNKKGLQTGAVYGFATTLLRLLKTEKPDHLAVVFDGPEKTFRHEKFPAYKATREKMPEEMADQLPYIRKVVEAMRIPFLVKPGFEADDIIGTLALQAEKVGMEAFLVTGDKDFIQLLSPTVKIYNMKKMGEVEILDPSAAQTKWGVPSDRITDLLALMGDSSDNVPGVPGVGEKTALKLLQEFGSLDEIYRQIDKVTPPKLQDKMREFENMARLCKELVTIHTNVPLAVNPHDLEMKEFDIPKLRELFEELDFHSLLDQFAGQSVQKTSTEKEKYVLVNSDQLLENLADTLRKAKTFVVDTETTSLEPLDSDLVGISFSTKAGSAYYVPMTGGSLSRDQVMRTLKPILEDPKISKGGHNVKYDLRVLRRAGIDLQGVTFDTMVESYLLDSGSRQHGLDSLALTHLGIEKIKTEELIGSGSKQISMAEVDVGKVAHYASEDADMTLRLHDLFKPQLEHQELTSLYQEVELPLVRVLADMEERGIAIDSNLLNGLSREMAKRMGELTSRAFELAGGEFNLNSPKQLGPILFERLRVQDAVGNKRVRKTKTGYSTDQETLEQYRGHPIIDSILEYRNLSKLRSTYTEALPAIVHPRTKRVHTSFNQTVTATGRLSSSDPNLQNIPIRSDLGKEIRKAFIPSEAGWKLMSADYSQIELRILAHLAKDATFIDAFKKGEDIHRRTAAVVFGVDPEKVTSELRSRAKAINFGIVYGMGPQRLAQETGISMTEAKDFIEAYFEKYSSVKKFLDRQISDAKAKGYVTTLLGRRRNLAEINSTNPRLSSNAERIATNTPIQGSAADLIKIAMIKIAKAISESGLKARMLLQVHDELVLEAPEDEIQKLTKLVKNGMESAIQLTVPVVAEIGVGANWAEAH